MGRKPTVRKARAKPGRPAKSAMVKLVRKSGRSTRKTNFNADEFKESNVDDHALELGLGISRATAATQFGKFKTAELVAWAADYNASGSDDDGNGAALARLPSLPRDELIAEMVRRQMTISDERRHGRVPRRQRRRQ